MTNSQKMQEVTGVDNLLREAGLQDLVNVTVEVMMNDRGKNVPHVVARYSETSKEVNETKDDWVYVEKITEKIEELNKYFSSGIFAMGITQRANWLKASMSAPELSPELVCSFALLGLAGLIPPRSEIVIVPSLTASSQRVI